MRKVRGVAAATVLAGALFLGGTLLPASGPRPASAVADIDPGQALAPAGGGRSLDATIEALQQRLKTTTPDAQSLAQLGLAYLQKARITADPSYYPKAYGVLRRSLDLAPEDNVTALAGMGALAGARHEFSEQLRWGRMAVEVSPDSPFAHGIVVDALIELGRYDAAGDSLQTMVDLRPDLASFSRISYYSELRGDVDGAISAMRRAARSGNPFGEGAAWARFQLGELHLSVGRVDAAAKEFERAAQIAPDYYLPKVGLARVATARGDLQQAISIYSDIVDRYPAPIYVMALGDLLGRVGDEAGARRNYDLVRVQQRLAEAAGVVSDVELTIFYADHGLEPKKTLATARRQYSERPSIRTADALAWSLYANGRYGEARRYAEEALRLGTKDALYLFHAGMIASRLNDEPAARSYLSRALGLNPTFSVLHARTARQELRAVSR